MRKIYTLCKSVQMNGACKCPGEGTYNFSNPLKRRGKKEGYVALRMSVGRSVCRSSLT